MGTAAIIIVAGLCSVMGVAGGQWWFGQRQWVARWRGHQVSVRYEKGKILLEIDGERVIEQRLRFILGGKTTGTWTHPAMGQTEIVISKNVIGAHGEYSRTLQIGDEIIPLAEVPRSWRGPRALLGLKSINPEVAEAFVAKLSTGEIEPLGDPRWIAACRILHLVRGSSVVSDDVRHAANVLQKELRMCFESRQRLAEQTVSELGEGCAELNAVREKLESKILDALEAVKSLHMAIVSIEAHADESQEMERVRHIIEGLQAEEEVARFVATLPKASDGVRSQPPALESPDNVEALEHHQVQ